MESVLIGNLLEFNVEVLQTKLNNVEIGLIGFRII